MKDTLVTNKYIERINESIDKLSLFTTYEDGPLTCQYPGEFIDDLEMSLDNLKFFNIELVKSEFVDTLEDNSKLFFQKKLFELRFERLLNWKHNQEDGDEENKRKYNREFEKFLEYQITFDKDVFSSDYIGLDTYYINLSATITMLKQQVKTMLAHFEELGNIYLQANNLKAFSNIGLSTPAEIIKETHIRFKPASKCKTDFIKILSAMYDAKMFVDAEGNPVTNKQKLMEAFGEFLGEDFSAYSASLSQAKNRGEKTFMKPFKTIEKEALRYFNALSE